jgi:hypothetical protein
MPLERHIDDLTACDGYQVLDRTGTRFFAGRVTRHSEILDGSSNDPAIRPPSAARPCQASRIAQRPSWQRAFVMLLSKPQASRDASLSSKSAP